VYVLWTRPLHFLSYVYVTPTIVLDHCDKQLFIQLYSFLCQNTTYELQMEKAVLGMARRLIWKVVQQVENSDLIR
jgi:hypothetical protein